MSSPAAVADATEGQRAAQKRIVGVVRASCVLGLFGLALWREADAGEWKASAEEVAADLAVLGVPHTVVGANRPPTSRSPMVRRGREIRVVWDDLPALTRWMPSLAKAMEDVPEDALDGKGFAFFEPQPGGMAVLRAAFAADFPWWTAKQAARMGLLCSVCGWDLRQRGPEGRAGYRILGEDGRRRMFCGPCCNNGCDALERWNGAGG